MKSVGSNFSNWCIFSCVELEHFTVKEDLICRIMCETFVKDENEIKAKINKIAFNIHLMPER